MCMWMRMWMWMWATAITFSGLACFCCFAGGITKRQGEKRLDGLQALKSSAWSSSARWMVPIVQMPNTIWETLYARQLRSYLWHAIYLLWHAIYRFNKRVFLIYRSFARTRNIVIRPTAYSDAGLCFAIERSSILIIMSYRVTASLEKVFIIK